MVLTTKKEAQLKRMPIIESKLRKSKDGKYMVHQTVITSIRPTDYYDSIISGPVEEDALEVAEESVE
ncbi:hypothetical protein HN587_05630 [Candidatus Woesearchaeota archaeon]|jgi:hypothetical protein|nr:hypothetical protein [Candidatus Woesearchaeota archaeon]